MRTYRIRILVLFVILISWSVAASAVTLRLKKEHRTLYGVVLQASRNAGAPQGRAANIISLVAADNGFAIGDLNRLPLGAKVVVKDRYLRRNFRPSRQAVQFSRMIFDLDVHAVSAAAAAPLAPFAVAPHLDSAAAQKIAMLRQDIEFLKQRATAAEAAQASLGGELRERDIAIRNLNHEVATLQAEKKPGGFAELFRGIRSFFRLHAFLVLFLRLAIVFVLFAALAAVVIALFRRRYAVMMYHRQYLTVEGIVESEVQADRTPVLCKTCKEKEKPDGQCIILRKNWTRHLKDVHGGRNAAHRSGPRPVDDPNLIIGHKAKAS